MTYDNSMKQLLGLEEHDQMMGLIYLGYSDEPSPPAKRNIALSEKTVWKD